MDFFLGVQLHFTINLIYVIFERNGNGENGLNKGFCRSASRIKMREIVEIYGK